MGARGPVPKRSDQRRRRNKDWIDEANKAAAAAAKSTEPPRSGRGSGAPAWREYAKALGYTVPDGASRAEVIALIEAGPPTGDDAWHPIARDWYRSLGESGQSEMYQPSDWQTARVLAEVLSRALNSGKVPAALLDTWQRGATELLTTEGARRRARIELERTTEEPRDEKVALLDEYRRRTSG